MKRKKYSKNASSANQIKTLKKSKTGIIIVSLIIFLMVFSVIASIFFYRDPQNEANPGNVYFYNNNDFKLTQNGWELQKNGRTIMFDYLPEDLNDITLELGQINQNPNSEKYIIFDSSQLSQNAFEIYKFKAMTLQNGEVYYPACDKQENCGDLPIKKCEAGDVYFKISSSNSIKQENECIILESLPQDTIKVINKYMYAKLGII